MAGGYLGKISAVISANTGDYVRGLNEGAKATRDFAKTVQSTLNRSATEAAKAFEGIYTPLQQFERAIRQAGALRLNFKGFEGAVRNINDLQKRLNGVLTNNEIDLVVRTSGLKDIEAVRQAINSLSQKEITLTSNAGGLPGLLKARAELERSGGGATTILNTKATQAELDALIQKLNVLDDRRIEVIIDVLNQQGLEKAVLAARRLQDAVTNIARPFAQTTQTFNQLAGSVQAAFIPAFGKIQTAVDRFGADLESTASVSVDRFEAVRQGAEKAAAAVNRLAEAQRLASSGATGRELAFVSPRVADELRQSAALRNQAIALPPSVIENNPQIAKDVAQLQNLANLAQQYNAEVESQRFLSLDTTQAEKKLGNVLLTSERVRGTLSETISLSTRGIDFVSSQGNPDGEFGPSRPFTTLGPNYFRPPPVPPRPPLDRPDIPSSFGGDPRAGVGRDAGDSARQVELLTSRANSLKSTLDTLPDGLRTGLIPAIQAADNELIRLKAAPAATAAEVARVATQFANVERAVARAATAAQRFGGSFADFRADRDSRAAAAGLEFLRTQLLRATGDATNAVAAVDRLAEAFQEAASTPGGFEANRAGLERLTNDAIQAASATEGVNRSQANLQRGFARAGDVARGAFGNASLAIQQAAFAFDDFFSVTGDIGQRIRAAGNNISQLGFILGGTWGLGVGIAVSVGAQFAAMLIKWANNGRTAEDQLKALNDVLARQRALTKEVADAISQLGDNLAGRAFSEAAGRARDFTKALEEIIKKQRELRQERLVEFDPEVRANRDRQAVIQRQLDNEVVAPEERLRLQLELDQLRRRERNARDAALQGVDFRRTIAGARGALAAGFEAQRIGEEFDSPNAQRGATARLRGSPLSGAALGRADFFADEVFRQGSGQAQIELLRRRQGDLRQSAIANPAAADIINTAIVEIERIIRAIEDRIAAGGDQAIVAFLRSLESTSANLQDAQRKVSAAFEAGLPGATVVQASLDSLTTVIDSAQAAISDAEKRFLEGAINRDELDATVSAERERAGAARAGLRAVVAQADALDAYRKNIDVASSALQRFTDALQASTRTAEANLSSAEGRRDRAREEVLGRPTPRNERALRQAERDVERQRELVENARREEAQAQERARSNPAAIADERRLREIEGLLGGADGFIDQAGRQRLIDERETLRERQEARARDAADDPRVSAARIASIREEQRQRMAAEGRDLKLDPGERARIELDDQIAKTRAATANAIDLAIEQGRPGDIAGIQAEQLRDEARLREEAARREAPTIFGLADQVQNAILQGPSRAALAPTDVTTMEGSRELTRLLRGDDASRNQDLVNLQKEANRLLKVLADGGADVAE